MTGENIRYKTATTTTAEDEQQVKSSSPAKHGVEAETFVLHRKNINFVSDGQGKQEKTLPSLLIFRA